MIEGGVTPNLNSKQLLELGYRLAVFPLSGLFAATYAIDKVFMELKSKGTTRRHKNNMTTFDNFNKLVDLQMYQALEEKYTTHN
jgi:methylisocitrate lyase